MSTLFGKSKNSLLLITHFLLSRHQMIRLLYNLYHKNYSKKLSFKSKNEVIYWITMCLMTAIHIYCFFLFYGQIFAMQICLSFWKLSVDCDHSPGKTSPCMLKKNTK